MKIFIRQIALGLYFSAFVANAGLFDFVFGPKGASKDRLSFRNPDRDCVGISTIESKFSKDNRKNLFNSKAAKDTPYEVERKLRAYLNGENIQFNGYANLNEMSAENKDLFQKLTREIQLKYRSNFENNGGRSVSSAQEESRYIGSVYQKARNNQLSTIAITDGRGAHALTVVSVISEQRDRVILRVRDPDARGLKKVIVYKDAQGNLTNRGYFPDWKSDVSFVGASDEKHKARVGRSPKYTNVSSRSSREGVWGTH